MAKAAKSVTKVAKVSFGKRRKGKARKRVNKHLRTKRVR